MLPGYKPTHDTVAQLIEDAGDGIIRTDTGLDQAASDALLTLVQEAPHPTASSILAVWRAAGMNPIGT